MAMERNILFTGSDDCTIKLWEVINYSLLFTIKQHEEPIRDMLIIEETGHLVTCSDDGKIYIWNYPKRTIVEVEILISEFLKSRKLKRKKDSFVLHTPAA
mgnify:CR=1 FL=1|jgi:FOG: WD40 repeat